MHRRVEERFQVRSTAKFIHTGDPERELPASILDISASGLLLLVRDALPLGTQIVVVTEHHLILAEVRNSDARGTGFAVGTRRLKTWEIAELSPDFTLLRNMQLLLASDRPGVAVEEVPLEPALSEPMQAELIQSEPPQSEPVRHREPASPEPLQAFLRPAAPLLPKPPAPTARQFSSIGLSASLANR
ncbi:MAG TPA: PilZ domain-containing protein [Bryobacteraceae bacterium]|jgi:hypothetical protein